MRKKIIPLAVLIGFLMIGSGAYTSVLADGNESTVDEDGIQPIGTITYKAQKNPETEKWVCNDGTSGCVPS